MKRNSTKQKIKALLNKSGWKLSSEELFITHCYFGFFDNNAMSSEEIGRMLGLYTKQVNRRLNNIMRKLVGSLEYKPIAA